MRACAVVLFVVAPFVAVLGLRAAGDAKDDAIKKEMQALKGTWVAVSLVVDGKKVDPKGRTVIFDGTGKVTVKTEGMPVVEATHRVDPTKKPKVYSVTQTSEGENKGKTYFGIYEVNGDTAKVCRASPGKERPTEFSSKPGSGHALVIYKRVKK
jgi:uncharacterized protein (TIGR03067 family)